MVTVAILEDPAFINLVFVILQAVGLVIITVLWAKVSEMSVILKSVEERQKRLLPDFPSVIQPQKAEGQ